MCCSFRVKINLKIKIVQVDCTYDFTFDHEMKHIGQKVELKNSELSMVLKMVIKNMAPFYYLFFLQVIMRPFPINIE